jgi:hypothetical protein
MTRLSWVEDLSGALRALPQPDLGLTLSLTHALGLSGSTFVGRIQIPDHAIDTNVVGSTRRVGDGLRYELSFDAGGASWSLEAAKRGFLRDPYAAFTTLRGQLRRGGESIGEILLRVDVRGGRLRELLWSVRLHA